MQSGKGLDVLVWTSPEDCENGILRIGKDSLLIETVTGKTLSSQSLSNIQYSITKFPPKMQEKIIFNHKFTVSRPYAPHRGQLMEDVFPPSTSGFYGRMRVGEDKAVFILQKIVDNQKNWLTIGDPKTGVIFDTLMIHPYEAEGLRMFDNQEIHVSWDASVLLEDPDSVRRRVLSILDEPSLDWADLAALIGDVSIPGLKLGKTMKETMSQLVPITFPDNIREELMAFLAFISKETVIEDPIDYLFRTDSLAIFGALMRGHQSCIAEKSDWPPYVKLLIQASRGHLEPPKRTISDRTKKPPWILFWQKVDELFPRWLAIAIKSANTLNKSDKIVLGLPTTKSQARKSTKSWKSRFAALSHELRIRGDIDASAIGLSEVLYIGAAYRWPHRHMKFITRLGAVSENPQHLQIMTMPQSSAERIKRFLPSSMKISWSSRVVNLDLFDAESENWIVPTSRIIDSLRKQSSLRKLANQFGSGSRLDSYQMTYEDTKVAGLISEGIHLAGFEKENYFDYWGLNKRVIRSVLSSLVKRNIIKLTYEVYDARLVSVVTIMEGDVKHLTSLTDAFLKYTPSSLALLNDKGNRCVILSRLSETSAFEMASQLPEQGLQNGLTIRCMKPMTYRSFSYNLYQRLLKPDGSWDDDVSAFLSQARSKRKELSESNA